MLRVAIAGCHRQLLREPGSHNFASAFCANPGTAVAGVFDYGAEERAGFVECWRDVWGEVPAFDDYERLLDEVRPDIVCIATRQTMHADQIEKAVAAGARGILCDKPLVTRLAELDRVAAACESTPLAFALDRRWNPAYHALRSALAAKPIGEITSISAYGIPNTINHGCHWYDALLMLLGDPEPAWVSGFLDPGDPHDERRRSDPPCRAQIGLADGVHAYVTCDGPRGPRLRDRRRGRADLRVLRRRGGPCPHGRIGRGDPPAAEGRGLARRHGHGRRSRAGREGGGPHGLRRSAGEARHRDRFRHLVLLAAGRGAGPAAGARPPPAGGVVSLGERGTGVDRS